MGRRVFIRVVLLRTKDAFIVTNFSLGHWFIQAKQKLWKILVVVNSFGYGWVATAIS